MRRCSLVLLVTATALALAVPAHAAKPSQAFIRPFDETIEIVNEEGTCAFQIRMVGIQIFRLYFDRNGDAIVASAQRV